MSGIFFCDAGELLSDAPASALVVRVNNKQIGCVVFVGLLNCFWLWFGPFDFDEAPIYLALIGVLVWL